MPSSQKDLLDRLADLGEEAIGRLGEMPGMGPAAKLLAAMRDRIEDLQHTVAGVQGLERRVERLEREVAELRGDRPAPTPPVEVPRPDVPAPPPPAGPPGPEEG
jgi:hypothetical protein